MTPQIHSILNLMPDAVTARSFESTGGSFDGAQLHITSSLDSRDAKGLHATIETLTKYGADAIAYHLGSFFGAYSLEVLFKSDESGNGAVRMWNKTANTRAPKRH